MDESVNQSPMFGDVLFSASPENAKLCSPKVSICEVDEEVATHASIYDE